MIGVKVHPARLSEQARELREAFHGSLARELGPVIEEAGRDLVKYAREYAPRDTGALKAGIHSKTYTGPMRRGGRYYIARIWAPVAGRADRSARERSIGARAAEGREHYIGRAEALVSYGAARDVRRAVRNARKAAQARLDRMAARER